MSRIEEDQGQRQAAIGQGSFPCKVHEMLDDVEAHGLSYIVSWQPHGRCFIVSDRALFVERILPLYFRMSKFSSFQRQLNLYNFNRITTGRDNRGYYHQLFLRGLRDLSRNIQRQQVKGTGVRQATLPEQEPNFYLMDIMPPSCNNATKAPNTSVVSADTAPASQLGTILPSALPYFHQPSNIQRLNVVCVPLSENQYSNMASIRSQLQQHPSTLNVSSFPSEYLRSWLERLHVASHNPTLVASDFHPSLATWPHLEQSHEHAPASSQPNMESDAVPAHPHNTISQ